MKRKIISIILSVIAIVTTIYIGALIVFVTFDSTDSIWLRLMTFILFMCFIAFELVTIIILNVHRSNYDKLSLLSKYKLFNKETRNNRKNVIALLFLLAIIIGGGIGLFYFGRWLCEIALKIGSIPLKLILGLFGIAIAIAIPTWILHLCGIIKFKK